MTSFHALQGDVLMAMCAHIKEHLVILSDNLRADRLECINGISGIPVRVETVIKARISDDNRIEYLNNHLGKYLQVDMQDDSTIAEVGKFGDIKVQASKVWGWLPPDHTESQDEEQHDNDNGFVEAGTDEDDAGWGDGDGWGGGENEGGHDTEEVEGGARNDDDQGAEQSGQEWDEDAGDHGGWAEEQGGVGGVQEDEQGGEEGSQEDERGAEQDEQEHGWDEDSDRDGGGQEDQGGGDDGNDGYRQDSAWGHDDDGGQETSDNNAEDDQHWHDHYQR